MTKFAAADPLFLDSTCICDEVTFRITSLVKNEAAQACGGRYRLRLTLDGQIAGYDREVTHVTQSMARREFGRFGPMILDTNNEG